MTKVMIPFLCGSLTSLAAVIISGWTGLIWFTFGFIFGGWVPLYLAPWLQRRYPDRII